jgi:hypothetical protein
MPEERPKAGNSAVAVPTAAQRAHPRYQFTATAEALDSQHRLRMSARTSDLGKGGCYLDTFSPFPMRTRVKLRITKEKISFEAEATVVYSKIGMGMGLAFTFIDPQQMGVLEKWLGELSGSSPCELSEINEQPASSSNGGSAREPGYVLNDLIVALMRKGTLSEEEGRTMLLRLVHHDFRP